MARSAILNVMVQAAMKAGRSLARDFGVPSLNTLASMSVEQTDATGSGADIVRVDIRRAAS